MAPSRARRSLLERSSKRSSGDKLNHRSTPAAGKESERGAGRKYKITSQGECIRDCLPVSHLCCAARFWFGSGIILLSFTIGGEAGQAPLSDDASEAPLALLDVDVHACELESLANSTVASSFEILFAVSAAPRPQPQPNAMPEREGGSVAGELFVSFKVCVKGGVVGLSSGSGVACDFVKSQYLLGTRRTCSFSLFQQLFYVFNPAPAQPSAFHHFNHSKPA